jgi:hypothetical protein
MGLKFNWPGGAEDFVNGMKKRNRCHGESAIGLQGKPESGSAQLHSGGSINSKKSIFQAG